MFSSEFVIITGASQRNLMELLLYIYYHIIAVSSGNESEHWPVDIVVTP
jgi:hypothetical protein